MEDNGLNNDDIRKQLCLECEKKQMSLTYEERIKPAYERIQQLKNKNPAKIGDFLDLRDEEKYTELAAELALFEEYELLDRLFEEAKTSAFQITREMLLNKRLQPQFAFYEPTPLFYVSGINAGKKLKDQKKMLEYLVKHGAEIDMESGEGFTPLLNHCYNNGMPQTLKTLLELGANPDKMCNINETAWTPLLFCLSPVSDDEDENKILPYSDTMAEKIKILLENGADPNLLSQSLPDLPPLMLALRCVVFQENGNENNLKIIEMLLKHGADPNFTDSDLTSPLDFAGSFAADEGEKEYELKKIMELLEKYGAKCGGLSPAKRTENDNDKSAQGYFKTGSLALKQKDYTEAARNFFKATKEDFGQKKYHKAFAKALRKRGVKQLEKKDAAKAENLYLNAKKTHIRTIDHQEMWLEAFLLGHLDAGAELRTSFVCATATIPEGKALTDLLVKANHPQTLCKAAHKYNWFLGGRHKKKAMELFQRAADLGYEEAAKTIENIKQREREEKEKAKAAKEFAKNNPPLYGEERKKCEEELKEMLRSLSRKAAVFIPEKCRTPLPAKQMLLTHIGGVPYFEEGAKWPHNSQGEPFEFILQIFQNSENSLPLPDGIKLLQVFIDQSEYEHHIVIYHELNTEKASLIDCPEEETLCYMALSFKIIDMLPDYWYLSIASPAVMELAGKIHPAKGESVIEDLLKKLGWKVHDEESYLGGYWGDLSNSSLGHERRKTKSFFQIYFESDNEGAYGWRRWDDAMIYAAYNENTKEVKSELIINYD